MRYLLKSGKTASHVNASRSRAIRLCCAGVAFGLLFACGKSKELREWRPEDHQAPPSVLPEGQGAAEETGDSNARAAAALWTMRCATCHGEGGNGDGPGRPPGANLPNFADPNFQAARTDVQLHDVIAKGRGLMPPFAAEISEEGIAALIAHVRTLRAK